MPRCSIFPPLSPGPLLSSEASVTPISLWGKLETLRWLLCVRLGCTLTQSILSTPLKETPITYAFGLGSYQIVLGVSKIEPRPLSNTTPDEELRAVSIL